MKLSMAALVALALCFLGSSAAYPSFEWEVDLGGAGIEINGAAAGDEAGFSVAMLNVNGDDFTDLLIGAPHANGTGVVYLVYGKADFFTGGSIDLDDLGTSGVVINGEIQDDLLGRALASVGDVNTDGKDDFLVGAPGFDGGMTDKGRCYLIYGRNDFGTSFNVADADLIMDGAADFEALGQSMGSAGNFGGAPNPKGIVIGAPFKDTLGIAAGAAYVVFWDGTLSGTVAIDSLVSQGKALAFTGNQALENAGFSVAGGFDYNKDTFDDLLIGVPGADYGSAFLGGRAYLVLGGDTSMSGTLDLNTLSTGISGVAFDGASNFEQAGLNVLGITNFIGNDDGFDDIVISAPLASTNGLYSGQVYVVHGSTATASPIDLGSIGPGGGTIFLGSEAEDGKFGLPLASVGDVDHDGTGDLAIGASYASRGSQEFMGLTYVAMGSRHPQLLEVLGSLMPRQPVITGAEEGDFSGCALAGGGDVNHDGQLDLVIGARGFESAGEVLKGRIHVVPGTGFAEASLGNGMTETPYIDASGDLTPGSSTGFTLHLQVDKAWSSQTSPNFPGYFLLGFQILNPGATYRNITIWPDILQPGSMLFWMPVNSATGYAEISLTIPAGAPSAQLVLQEIWPNPTNPNNNYAATNCIALQIP